MKQTYLILFTVLALLLQVGCNGGKKKNNAEQNKKIEEKNAFPNDFFGTENPDREVFEVRSASDFFNAVGSNRILRIVTDNIDLSDFPEFENSHISDVENMTIEGIDPKLPTDMYVNTNDFSEVAVLEFMNCKNIVLRNLRLGHYPETYSCNAPVVAFNDCEKITIEECILYGCGTEGIDAQRTHRLLFSNSTIESCTYNAISLIESSDFVSSNATIAHNKLYSDLIMLKKCDRIGFIKSHITDNSLSGSVVSAQESRQITFNDCVVENNVAESFSEKADDSEIILNNTKFTPLSQDDYYKRIDSLRSLYGEQRHEVDTTILSGRIVCTAICNVPRTQVIASLFFYNEQGDSEKRPPEMLTHCIFGNRVYPVVFKEEQKESEEFNYSDSSSEFENMGGFVYETNEKMTYPNEDFEYSLLVSQSFLKEFSIVPLNTSTSYISYWNEEPETAFQKEAVAKMRVKLQQKTNRKVMTAKLIGASTDNGVLIFEVVFVPKGNITIGSIAIQSPSGISLLEEPAITTLGVSVWRVDDDGIYLTGYPRKLFKDKHGNYHIYMERPASEGTNVFIYSERKGKLIPSYSSSFEIAP